MQDSHLLTLSISTKWPRNALLSIFNSAKTKRGWHTLNKTPYLNSVPHSFRNFGNFQKWRIFIPLDTFNFNEIHSKYSTVTQQFSKCRARVAHVTQHATIKFRSPISCEISNIFGNLAGSSLSKLSISTKLPKNTLLSLCYSAKIGRGWHTRRNMR